MSKFINQSLNIYQPNGRFVKNLNSLEQKRLYFSNDPAGVIIQKGKKKVRSDIPPGMIIVKDFLNKNQCKQLKDYASSEVGVPHAVGGLDKDGNLVSVISDDRKTDYIAIDGILEPIKEIYQRAFKAIIDPHYGIQTEWYTTPSILRYGIGGNYVEHSDSENWNGQEKKWFKHCDRDFSQLLYLNNDYTGGALYFPNFDFRFQPKAGMLVSFPSDHRYLHQAETVASGIRYAIVSWAVARNSRRILAEKPNESIIISAQ